MSKGNQTQNPFLNNTLSHVKNEVSLKTKPSHKQLNYLVPQNPLKNSTRNTRNLPDIEVESLSNKDRQSVYSVEGISISTGLRPINSNRSRPPSSQRSKFKEQRGLKVNTKIA